MPWMTANEVNKKVDNLGGISLARYVPVKPAKGIPPQPEVFTLGRSATYWPGTHAKNPLGSYRETTGYDIKGLKIPSRIKGKIFEGSLTPPTIDHLSVLIVGGLLGNELIGPEASLYFAETFLTKVKGYTKNDSSLGTKYSPAQNVIIDGYSLDHTRVEAILDKLNIWVVPLVNPGGREELLDQHASIVQGKQGSFPEGRPNPPGICINRNFDIGQPFRTLFHPTAWKQFLNASDPLNPSPSDPKANYEGPRPNSEPETLAVLKVLNGDPSVTWVFDIHGQDETNCKVSFPWSFEEIQMGDKAMCIKNPLYDYAPTATGSGGQGRDGYNPSSYPMFVPPPKGSPPGTKPTKVNPSGYGEYLPPKTAGQLKELAGAFTNGAEQCFGNSWDTPTQGAVRYRCVGSLDDYALWLDRNHVRSLTIECAWLQPSDQDREIEMHEVAAGLFQAIDRICTWVEQSMAASGSTPQEDLSRLSKDVLTCP